MHALLVATVARLTLCTSKHRAALYGILADVHSLYLDKTEVRVWTVEITKCSYISLASLPHLSAPVAVDSYRRRIATGNLSPAVINYPREALF